MGHEDDEPLSDEELFRRAVERMEPDEVYRGKYEGEGPRLEPPGDDEAEPDDQQDARNDVVEGKNPEQQEERETRAREEIERRRDLRNFERAIGPVDERIESDKYRKRRPPEPNEDIERLRRERGGPPAEMVTPPLPKEGQGLHDVRPLDAAYRALIERCEQHRGGDLPELHIRGDTVDEARARLEVFVRRHADASTFFVRIIHGRGLRSTHDPVLKPMVLRWLEGDGVRFVRGYAPEANKAGDYGSVIVELRRVSD